MFGRCLEDVTDRSRAEVDPIDDLREFPLQEYTDWVGS